jgi:hypothetical protein
MGYRWSVDEDLWSADVADIGALNAAEILKHTPTATAQEKGFLKEDEKLSHFNDARVHRQMQVTLSTVVFMLSVNMLYFRNSTCSIRPLGLGFVSGLSSLGQADLTLQCSSPAD